jgi:hypothetical protein
MSNIEHSEYICDDGCGRVDVRGAVEGPWPLCLNCGARVTEYVPADAYRGAVETMEWLTEALKRAHAVLSWRNAHTEATEADRKALQEAARRIVGGQ